jgi:hypothetical protein
MQKNRYINTRFWDDDYIGDLAPLEKLMFLYLLTNSCTNILGIYEITDKRISFDTGIQRQDVKAIMDKFASDGKVKRIKDYVVMINFAKHQEYKGTLYNGALRVYGSLPSHVIDDQDVADIKYYLDTLSIPYPYPIDTPSIPYPYPIDTASDNLNSESLIINSNNTSIDNTISLSSEKSDGVSEKVNKITYSHEFEQAWEAYGKRGGKEASFKEWKKLSKADKETAMEHIPVYAQAHAKEPQYKQHFQRYIREGTFHSAVVMRETNNESDYTKYQKQYNW